jgi:divalent metal cation (Fe/Co/Zn/Cd) transporter
MPPELTLEEAHDKTNLIENAIRDKLNIEATIHMEPTIQQPRVPRSHTPTSPI